MSKPNGIARAAIYLALIFGPGALLAGKPPHNLNPVNQPSDPALYVGADTCKTCHQPEAASYDRGAHWRTEVGKHKGPQWQGCEAATGQAKLMLTPEAIQPRSSDSRP